MIVDAPTGEKCNELTLEPCRQSPNVHHQRRLSVVNVSRRRRASPTTVYQREIVVIERGANLQHAAWQSSSSIKPSVHTIAVLRDSGICLTSTPKTHLTTILQRIPFPAFPKFIVSATRILLQLHLFDVHTDQNRNSRGTRNQGVVSSWATSGQPRPSCQSSRWLVCSLSLCVWRLYCGCRLLINLIGRRVATSAVGSVGNCYFPFPGRDVPLLISVLPSFRSCDELNRGISSWCSPRRHHQHPVFPPFHPRAQGSNSDSRNCIHVCCRIGTPSSAPESVPRPVPTRPEVLATMAKESTDSASSSEHV